MVPVFLDRKISGSEVFHQVAIAVRTGAFVLKPAGSRFPRGVLVAAGEIGNEVRKHGVEDPSKTG